MSNNITPLSDVGSVKYVLSAIESNGKRGFYAIDSSSGGYPYWSHTVRNAELVDSLDKLDPLDSVSYMRNNVTNIEVLKIETIATVVSTEEIVSAARAKALAEIAELENLLRKKTDALRSLK
jgi:hypothetical protein